jgi:hypothetical protein
VDEEDILIGSFVNSAAAMFMPFILISSCLVNIFSVISSAVKNFVTLFVLLTESCKGAASRQHTAVGEMEHRRQTRRPARVQGR